MRYQSDQSKLIPAQKRESKHGKDQNRKARFS